MTLLFACAVRLVGIATFTFSSAAAAVTLALAAFAPAAFAQRPEDRPLPSPPPVQVELRFDFTPGPARAGHTSVAAEAVYTPERGHGFDFGSTPRAERRTDGESQRDGFITAAESPLFFSVQVPEGNYRVTVTLGDTSGETRTTLRAEAAHLLAADLVTRPGEFLTRTFYANVRRPGLSPPPKNAPGGSRVHMFLAGEAEARAWDEKLTLEFNGPRPALVALEILKDDAVPTLFVAGDSTVGDPRRGPGGNWPTQLCQFFKPEIVVCNSAEGGETSKSFITGYRFDKVLSQMKAGDFFLIQFGHNDSKAQWPQTYVEPFTTYKAYLKVFVAEARRRGATPVLVTSMHRRAFDERGKIKNTHGDYPEAVRQVAREENVALIDLHAMSAQLYEALGPEKSPLAFSNGGKDATHHNNFGAYELAQCVVTGIREAKLPLAALLAEDAPQFAPAKPDAVETFAVPPSPGYSHVKPRGD